MADENSVIIGIGYDKDSGKEWQSEAQKDIKKVTKVIQDQQTKTSKVSASAAKKAHKDEIRAQKESTKEINAQASAQRKLNSELGKTATIWDRIRKVVSSRPNAGGPGGGPPGRGPGGGSGSSGRGPNGRRSDPIARVGGGVADAMGIPTTIPGAAMAAVTALWQANTKYFTGGLEAGTNLRTNMAKMAHLAPRFGGSTDRAQDALFTGGQYGFGADETMGHMTGLARATGGISSMNLLQARSRALGMDVGELTGFAGGMTRAGTDINSAAGMKKFSRVLGDGVRSGLDSSRTGEHLDAVASLVSNANSVAAGEVDTTKISQLLATLGANLGAGFQGARGAAVVSKLDNAVKNPGGGEAGRAFMQQAFGFGLPGGNASYYDVTKRMQQGITGNGGSQNLIDMIRYNRATAGVGQQANMQFSSLTGLSLDIVEKLMDAFGREDQTERFNEIINSSAELHDPMEDLAQSMRNFVKLPAELVKLQNDAIVATRASVDDAVKIQAAIAQLSASLTPLFNQLVNVLTPVAEALASLAPDIRSFAQQVADSIKEAVDFWREFFGERADRHDNVQALNKMGLNSVGVADLITEPGTFMRHGFVSDPQDLGDDKTYRSDEVLQVARSRGIDTSNAVSGTNSNGENTYNTAVLQQILHELVIANQVARQNVPSPAGRPAPTATVRPT